MKGRKIKHILWWSLAAVFIMGLVLPAWAQGQDLALGVDQAEEGNVGRAVVGGAVPAGVEDQSPGDRVLLAVGGLQLRRLASAAHADADEDEAIVAAEARVQRRELAFPEGLCVWVSAGPEAEEHELSAQGLQGERRPAPRHMLWLLAQRLPHGQLSNL